MENDEKPTQTRINELLVEEIADFKNDMRKEVNRLEFEIATLRSAINQLNIMVYEQGLQSSQNQTYNSGWYCGNNGNNTGATA